MILFVLSMPVLHICVDDEVLLTLVRHHTAESSSVLQTELYKQRKMIQALKCKFLFFCMPADKNTIRFLKACKL